MLGEQLGRRGDAVAPLRPMLSRPLADVRHRLVFRAHTFIKVPAGCGLSSARGIQYELYTPWSSGLLYSPVVPQLDR